MGSDRYPFASNCGIQERGMIVSERSLSDEPFLWGSVSQRPEERVKSEENDSFNTPLCVACHSSESGVD
jgi:hypothetical protein